MRTERDKMRLQVRHKRASMGRGKQTETGVARNKEQGGIGCWIRRAVVPGSRAG